MFSPDSSFRSVQSASSRNPRRRQRKDSDSIRQQPERKRSKLSVDTFQSPSNTRTNGNGILIANGHVDHAVKDIVAPERINDIPVREKKRAALIKKPAKGDGSTILTKNANYTVKQLPGLPERLRGNTNDGFRGCILPSSSYALALTHTHALIWDYNTVAANPVPRTLNLQYTSNRSDPLPLGSLVKNGTSSEIGLVLVMPTTGKVAFWENVDSAESLSLFQQRRQGVEGSVGSMLSGEVITDVIDAEYAGYILVFSTGRLAQLTLRDAQGRPHINAQFLRNSTTSTGGGLLGGLKSVFAGGGWRKDVAAVKTRPSGTKGHMEVITVTTSGIFQVWDISWAGQSAYKGEISAHMGVLSVLQGRHGTRGDESIRILDFTIVSDLTSENGTVALLGSDAGFRVVTLVAVDSLSSSSYALVPLTVGNGSIKIEESIRLDSYTPNSVSPSHKPRLVVPSPGHTAFALFSDAITVASLTGPTSRSYTQTASTTQPFQDTVYFRRDRVLDIVGFDAENSNAKSRTSSCIIFSKSAGLLRVVAEAVDSDGRPSKRSRVTAKSKLEQAIFYGGMPENVLDLSRKPDLQFAQEEVEGAALQISQEILGSASEYIPTMTASTEQQLSYRAKTLSDLASHLKKLYPPLTRNSKWRLLFDAERMAAARGMWKQYDARLRQTALHHRPLLDDLVDMLHERYKTATNAESGELDPVRHWFLKDIARIEVLLPWAFSGLGELRNDGIKDAATLMQLISEADDLLVGGMEAALSFRNEKAAVYGLEDENLDEGILVSGYEDLPSFWTSTHNIVNAILKLADYARREAVTHFERGPGPSSPDPNLMRKVALDNPRLVRLVCLTHIERYRWCLAQNDEKIRTTGRHLQHEFDTKVRHRQIVELAWVGMAGEGLKLAEKLRDMASLADLVHNELDYLREHSDESPVLTNDQRTELVHKQKEIQDHIDKYFKMFGDSFANAYYSNHIRQRKLGSLVSDAGSKYQRFLTRFLRADPSRAKVCWINDVLGEKDFAAASMSLMEVSRRQEPNFWCKKVELSLAKLALLASENASNGTDKRAKETQRHSQKSSRIDELESSSKRDLKLLAIQEKVYNHISSTAYGALDEDTAVDLVMQSFGRQRVDGRPALQQLIKRGFEELLTFRAMAPELLIDVLTLMDQAHSESNNAAHDICGREFLLALQVLDASGLEASKQAHESILKLVWKRCFIRDDWQAINNTASKADELLQEELERTTLLRTLKEGVMHSLWDTSPSFQRVAPSDSLGAGCKAQELKFRFPSEELCEPIAHDNALDDALLDKMIKQCRLGHWYSACKDAAVKAAHREAEAQAEASRAEREFMGALAEPQYAEVDERDMDGGVNGEADGVEAESEADNDVEMG